MRKAAPPRLARRWPLARLPVTCGLLAAMIAARRATGPLMGPLPAEALSRWGLSLETVAAGEIHRLATSTFLSHDGRMFVRQLAFAAAVTGAHEWREGSRRTLTTFALTDLVGSALVLAVVVAPLARLPGGHHADLPRTLDVGMSAGGFGLLGSLTAGSTRPRLALGLAVAGVGIKLALAPDVIADGAHLLSLVTGHALRSTKGS